MLLVETYISYSEGRGIGLFTKNDIPKGMVFWVRNEVFDKVFSPEQLSTLEPIAADYLKKHGFQEKNGNWYLCGDNARFSNHSHTPNSDCMFDDQGRLIKHSATENIESNTEIFCDYTELCLTCAEGVAFDI